MSLIQPHEMTRELRLKRALALLLPDEIEVTELCNFRWKCGDYAGEMLRDTEWHHVVNLVVEKLGHYNHASWAVHAEDVLRRYKIRWDI